MLLFCVAIGNSQNILSPSQKLSLTFSLSKEGKPTYSVNFKNQSIVKESTLAILLKGLPALDSNFRIDSIGQHKVNETWQPVLGEQSNIKNNYNQMTVALSQLSTNRKINLIFRVFDEGVAFRYEFPKQ